LFFEENLQLGERQDFSVKEVDEAVGSVFWGEGKIYSNV
jgi:hypothetical protein